MDIPLGYTEWNLLSVPRANRLCSFELTQNDFGLCVLDELATVFEEMDAPCYPVEFREGIIDLSPL